MDVSAELQTIDPKAPHITPRSSSARLPGGRRSSLYGLRADGEALGCLNEEFRAGFRGLRRVLLQGQGLATIRV